MSDNVRYLPSAAAAPDVVDAELVSDSEWREISQRERARARMEMYRAGTLATARTVRVVVTHEHTRRTGRQVKYVGIGLAVVAQRMWMSRSSARYDRYTNIAVQAGDQASALQWEEHRSTFLRERHERRMALLDVPFRAAKAAGISLGIGVGGELLLGIILAAAEKKISEVAAPFETTAELVKWMIVVGSVVWGWATIAALVIAVLTLRGVGQKAAEERGDASTRHVATQVDADGSRDIEVTPSIVVKALRDMGHASLAKAIRRMSDGAAALLSPIVTAGPGVEVTVRLPDEAAISPQELVADEKLLARLAGNLNRHPHEVYVTIPKATKSITLWVADSGALDEPLGASPLVEDATMTADVFNGAAPWGVTLRGSLASARMYMRHLLITGTSNMGKTVTVRALMLWLALDPCVHLHISDLKPAGDWAMFAPIADELHQVPGDEGVVRATEMVEGAVRELETRQRLIMDMGLDGVSEKLARTDARFQPRFYIVDEAQVAYASPAKDELGTPYGGTKANSRYFKAVRRVQEQGRAFGIHMVQGTQDPTDQNLPVLVRNGAHTRCGLKLSTKSQSAMALGETPVANGAAPHKLRLTDKGVVVVAGDAIDMPRGQDSVVIRTYYINADQAKGIIERAVALRSARAIEAAPTRDLLADLADAVSETDERVMLPDLPARLRQVAPDHEPYQKLTGKALEEQLRQLGIRVYTSGNRPQIDPADVRITVTARSSLGEGED